MAGIPHKRTREELWQEFDDQVKAWNSSKRQFDQGEMWEAPRLATTLANLVNDGRTKTKSILTQIGVRDALTFFSSARPHDPNNLLSDGAPLCVPVMQNDKPYYEPLFRHQNDASPPVRIMKFSDWWKEPVFTNKAQQPLSRMNLVWALRSKDGGSHYDGEIPASPYLDLKQQSGTWEYFEVDEFGVETVKPFERAHTSSMRQIAWEFDLTLVSIERLRGYAF